MVKPVVALAERRPSAEVIERLRSVLQKLEANEIVASRMVVAMQSRVPAGGREYHIFVAGDFNGVADEIGLLHTAAYTRMTGELE